MVPYIVMITLNKNAN